MTPAWSLAREVPPWLGDLEPLTTGLLGQKSTKIFTWGEAAAIGIRSGGVVYPVFPRSEGGVPPGTAEVLARVTEAWCLMGPTAWVEQALEHMPASKVSHHVDYDFLVRPRSDLSLPPGPGALRKADVADANALYPLQEGYEKEEVLFDPSEFQPLVSRLNLGRLLKTQTVVGLWENGRPVAKAGTNAMTARWAQIGGVYTLPEHRGQGHQKRLMAFLLQRLNQEGRSACLFVKQSNPGAKALYLGLGFTAEGTFRITYGQRRRG